MKKVTRTYTISSNSRELPDLVRNTWGSTPRSVHCFETTSLRDICEILTISRSANGGFAFCEFPDHYLLCLCSNRKCVGERQLIEKVASSIRRAKGKDYDLLSSTVLTSAFETLDNLSKGITSRKTEKAKELLRTI